MGEPLISRLESTEAAELGDASRTNISGGSAKLEASLQCLWSTWVSSDATFMMIGNTGVASVLAEVCGVTSMMAGGFGMEAILWRSSRLAAMTRCGSGTAAMTGQGSGVVAMTG